MKKLFLALAVVGMVGLFSSCSKTKVCHCSYTINVLGVETTVDLDDQTIESGTCADLQNAASWNVPGITEGSIHCVQK